MIDGPLAYLAEAFGGDPEPVVSDSGEPMPEIPTSVAAVQAASTEAATATVRNTA